jgi:hypothetical protein
MKRFTIACAAILMAAGCSSNTGLEGDAHDESGADVLDDAPVDGTVDPGSDATADCAAMDARAEGPCAVILPGFTWDGEHCRALGSGCGCAGEDCDRVYETMEQCVDARRPCYAQDCWPDDVHDDLCMDCTDEMFLGVFWNGLECYELRGCSCDGDDCDDVFGSVLECELVLSTCDSTLCRETGGFWIPADLCGPCGHMECGMPNPEACCSAGCNCGAGRSFFAGLGCDDDPSCTRESYCIATSGTWYPEEPCGPCGDYHCGEPSMLPCCDEGCDCGNSRNFVEGEGCVRDEECARDAGDLCTRTGGTWYPNEGCGPCGHYACGQPPMDACCDEGCDCGPMMNFDEERGCIPDESCIKREVGEWCWGSGSSSSCRPGLVCCDTCGFAPCPACAIPCCEESGICMEDGCPMPTP